MKRLLWLLFSKQATKREYGSKETIQGTILAVLVRINGVGKVQIISGQVQDIFCRSSLGNLNKGYEGKRIIKDNSHSFCLFLFIYFNNWIQSGALPRRCMQEIIKTAVLSYKMCDASLDVQVELLIERQIQYMDKQALAIWESFITFLCLMFSPSGQWK